MSALFLPQVSVAATRRRRFLWCLWWSGPPVHTPFRKPDAFQGGARTHEEALRMAERAFQLGHPERPKASSDPSNMTLQEVEPRWARAWGRTLVGDTPWPKVRGKNEHNEAALPVSAALENVANAASLWTILGTSKDATLEELKQAFRRRALEVHPDHGGTAEAFIKLKRAYETAQKRAARPQPKRKPKP
jgi:DnaJ domain